MLLTPNTDQWSDFALVTLSVSFFTRPHLQYYLMTKLTLLLSLALTMFSSMDRLDLIHQCHRKDRQPLLATRCHRHFTLPTQQVRAHIRYTADLMRTSFSLAILPAFRTDLH